MKVIQMAYLMVTEASINYFTFVTYLLFVVYFCHLESTADFNSSCY